LHAELKDICLKIGINDLDLNHLPNNKALNSKQPMDKMDKFGIRHMYDEFKSSPDSWKHILSEQTKSRIYEKHKREFELFDYSND